MWDEKFSWHEINNVEAGSKDVHSDLIVSLSPSLQTYLFVVSSKLVGLVIFICQSDFSLTKTRLFIDLMYRTTRNKFINGVHQAISIVASNFLLVHKIFKRGRGRTTQTMLLETISWYHLMKIVKNFGFHSWNTQEPFKTRILSRKASSPIHSLSCNPILLLKTNSLSFVIQYLISWNRKCWQGL